MSNDNPDYTTRLSNSLDELPKRRSVIDPSLLAIDLSPWERLDALEQEVKLLKEQIRDLKGD